MASTETRRIQFDFIARDRGVGRQMRETGEQAEEMNQGLEQGSGKMGKLSGAAAKLGPVLAGLGAAAALVGPLVAKGLDAGAATAKFQAQLGLTAKESERIGGVAGKLYSKAYGESMDDVRAAIASVVRNMDGMRTASNGALQETAARAMTLAEVMDEDVGRVTAAVSQMMRTGLAKNSKEAFDIMTKGAQMGANKAEDLADTFEEYAVQFQSLGLTGAQAMGLMVQGLKGGARNADLVADSIKEFSIEAVKGGEGVRKGLSALGFNADAMVAKFAAGGPKAAGAFDQMIDKLRAIKDPLERNRIAADLFGTKSEDMARALASLDPSKAATGMGKLAGATDKAGNAMHNTAKAKLTSFKRTLETQVTNVAGRAVVGLSRLGGEIKKGFKLPATGKAGNDMQRLGQILRQVADWVKTKVVPALRDLAKWFNEKIIPPVRKFYREVLGELGKQLRKIGKELDKSGIPWGKILKVVKKVGEVYAKTLGPVITWFYKVVLKALGTWIQWSIKTYGWLWKALVKTWDAFKRGGKVIKDWYRDNKKSIDGFRDMAIRAFVRVTHTFLDFVVTAVKGAAKAFGWVPGLGGKLKKAAAAVSGFRSDVNKQLDKITRNKNVNIKVRAGGEWKAPGGSWSPGSQSYAKGGRVWSTDPAAREAYDSVPAMLRLNEHVWTPEDVKGAGGHDAVYRLRALAKRGLLKGYAAGGAVGGSGVNVKVSTPNMAPVWTKVEAGMWAMVKKIAAALAKLGGGSTAVVRAARSQIGWPYSWGGGGKGGPSTGIGRGAGTIGFDCSGLTEYAWWKGAHKSIGGVTYSQHPASSPSPRRPGALGFNSSLGHVVLASDRPGYVIEAPYTGAHVREVRKDMPDWRWPKGAKFAVGGAVQRLGQQAIDFGGRNATALSKLAGIAGDPSRRRAKGGPVMAGQPYVVGERGAEVMVPHAMGTVYSAGTKVVNVTQNITLRVEATPGTNRAVLGRELNELLREYKSSGGRLVKP